METLATFTPEGILISGDQVGTVTDELYIPAGNGQRIAGTILTRNEAGKGIPIADGGTPFAVLAHAVDTGASAEDGEEVCATVYRTGQFTQSVMEKANEGVDLEALRSALRALNIHIQPDVA